MPKKVLFVPPHLAHLVVVELCGKRQHVHVFKGGHNVAYGLFAHFKTAFDNFGFAHCERVLVLFARGVHMDIHKRGKFAAPEKGRMVVPCPT